MTPERREANRLRSERWRRAHGIMPRKPAQKPWLAEGVSRSTWYRRRKKGLEAKHFPAPEVVKNFDIIYPAAKAVFFGNELGFVGSFIDRFQNNSWNYGDTWQDGVITHRHFRRADRDEAPDFRAPLPGSPISESMCAWIALICSA
jgi:hypothetical protein